MALQALAVDISLAALLGENIYNFGELLQHPMVCKPSCQACIVYQRLTKLVMAYPSLKAGHWTSRLYLASLAGLKHTQTSPFRQGVA